MPRPAPLLLLLASCPASLAPDSARDLATYIPAEVSVPRGAEATKLKLHIPARGEVTLSSPAAVHEAVASSWAAVVEPHAAGLTDPGPAAAAANTALSPGEAWHHYTAGRAGVVDSARFLITFSLVPSVQAGGGPLHRAASLGQADRVARLLEDGARVDEEKEDGNTALHCAAIMGHAAVVRLLAEEGANLEAAGRSGATPLMMAAAMGHEEAAAALLAAGADPDTPHTFGRTTAVHFAAEVGRVAVVRLLCQRGADVEAKKSTGGTALHTAVDSNMRDSVRVLVEECGARLDQLLNGDTSPLYLAAQRGYTELAVQLLGYGADVNFVMPRGEARGDIIAVGGQQPGPGLYPVKNTEVGNGATALHAAVENGHAECVAALLERGAAQLPSMEGATPLVIALQYRHPHIALQLLDPAHGDPRVEARVPADGSSALFVASLYNYEAVVARLLQRGASPAIQNNRGQTPLSAAASRGHQGVVQLLVAAGALEADPRLPPLHAAVTSGSLAVVRAVLASYGDEDTRRAALGARDASHKTPLHLAVAAQGAERLALVQELLQQGADPSATLPPGAGQATPLHLAALHGHTQVVAALLGAGAGPQPRASPRLQGATPLYLAAQAGHAHTAAALLDAGADPDPRLLELEATPLFVAADRGHVGVVRLLLGRGASPHIRNWNGVTALGVAALAGRGRAVASLLQAGANVNSRDNDGNTILLNCISQGQDLAHAGLGVIRQLLEAGADPDIQNSAGEAPLARTPGLTPHTLGAELARLLLEAGATIRSDMVVEVGSKKHTLLGAAIVSRHTELVALLLEGGEEDCEVLGEERGGCVELALATRHPDIISLVTRARRPGKQEL